jgi:hypothetical protein
MLQRLTSLFAPSFVRNEFATMSKCFREICIVILSRNCIATVTAVFSAFQRADERGRCRPALVRGLRF